MGALYPIAQRRELLVARFGRGDIEANPNRLEAHLCVARQAKRSAQVEVTVDRDLDVVERNAGGGRDHLARQLRTGGERAEQKIPRAGGAPGPADARMGLRLVDRPAEVDRARHRRISLLPAGDERDPRRRRVLPVALLERFLGYSKVDRAQSDDVVHRART
jgi:hypothetical protein